VQDQIRVEVVVLAERLRNNWIIAVKNLRVLLRSNLLKVEVREARDED
jgi:hypothetical protein